MKKQNKPTSKEEGNKYDKIVKENLQGLIPTLLRRIIGTDDYEIEDLPEVKIQSTIEREPDFLKIIRDANHPNGRLVHIEFQSKNESGMAARFLEYVAMEYRRYKLPVEPHLIFLGENRANMIDEIKYDYFYFKYHTHNLIDYSYKDFINSKHPEDLVAAILTGFEDLSSQEIIELIIQNLVKLMGETRATQKFFRQLEIMSKLRNLQKETFKITEKMDVLIDWDISEDRLYQKGEAQGIEKGIEKGLEKGIKRGDLRRIVIGSRNMLKKKFDIQTIADLLVVEPKLVSRIAIQLKKEVKILDLIKIKVLKNTEIAEKLKVSAILVEVIKEDWEKKNSK